MSFKSVFRNIFSIRPVKDDSGVAALVIITVAVVAAGAAISTATLMTSRRGLEVTQSQFGNFEKIQNAIEVFAIQDTLGNSSFLLPCPADGTLAAGNAHTHTGTTCDTASGENRGIVPWLTLGLAEEDVIDTNGNYITYIVNGSSVAACSNGNAATDSLTDTNGGTSTAYALISHGQNGFGAFNSQGQVLPTNASTNELDNCPNNIGNCTPSNTDGFRRGPQSETAGATLFDDVVRPVSFSETFATECPVIDEDPNEPVNAQIGFSNAETSRVFTRSINEITAQASNSFDATDYDADGDGNDETEVLRVNSNDAVATRSCAYTEPTFPLQGYTIRQYAEVFFESTNAASLGGGLVMGYFAHKTDGGIVTDITRPDPDGTPNGTFPLRAQPPCGGTDQYLGFGDENDGLTTAASDVGDYLELAQPNDVFRFGLEIDAQTGFVDSGIEQQIFDPTNNHIAILLGNNNHAGDETSSTQPPNIGALSATNLNGPVCRDDLDGATITGDPGDSYGVDPTARPLSFDRNVSASDSDLLEACYYPAADPTWLENGDPVDQGTSFADAYSQVRTEAHWHASNGCADPVNEIRFDAWVWNQSVDGACDSSTVDCDDLGSDYDDGTLASRRPHISACLAAEDVAGQNPLEAIRFGFTAGLPSNGGGNGGEITIQRFGLNFERTDGIGAKTYAGADAVSREITEEIVRNALFAVDPGGDLTLDQSYALIPAATVPAAITDTRLFVERGKFFLDENNYIGNQGVSDNNLIQNIDVGASPFQDETTFLEADAREKLTFEFDRLFRKFTVNLRDFGSTDNTANYLGGLNEQVLLRAYNTNLPEDQQLVATEIHRTCDVNGLANNNNSSMVISTDFGLSGSDYFDRVQIIPEPIDSTDIEGETRFYVGAAKACGTDVNCAFDPTLVADNNNNDTEFRCVSFTPIAAASIGTDDSGEINPDTVNPVLGEADNQNEDTDRAWLDLNNYPEDGLDIDLMITAIGEIRSQDTSNGNQGGFGVGNSYGTSGSFIDTVANPTGAEAEVETLTFHFEQRWNRLRIGFSRFGQEPNGGLDQAQIQLCDGGVDGECETLPTVTACPTADTNNNWRGDAFYTTGLSNLLFDTVIVTPQPNSLVAGDQQSDFYVRTLKACDAVGACTDLVYGDNSSQAARYCDLLNP